MTANETTDLRSVNARIAAGYDAMPFDPRVDPALTPERILGVAGLYGAGIGGEGRLLLDGARLPRAGAEMDVLDLGCGTGVQLAQVAPTTKGRLVGMDLSASACARARERCGALGERCTILEGDLADADPASLGAFDLIYHVGVLYLTPPAVQARILSLIAACLKPGGVAVISYFAGLGAMVMAGLNQMLRAQDDVSAAPKTRTAAARARIDEFLRSLERGTADPIVLQVLRYARGCDEAILFHEMLNQPLNTIPTVALEKALSPDGVHFLNWLVPGPFGDTASAIERARIADAFDLTGGGYHYGVFAKSADAAPDPRRVRWQTRLRRGNAGVFNDPATGRAVNVPTAATAAALDALASGPQPFTAFIAGGADTAALTRDVLGLWQMGLITPLSPA